VTLHALVRDEFQGQIAESADYYFCDAKGCDVVYFTTDGRTITKQQLKVEVGVKETSGDRRLCYCFGHSVATIKEELRMKGHTDALEDIRQKMKDLGCTCEVTNPSGSCCLGTVGRGIETAKAELNGTTPGRSRAETISKVGTVLSAVMASACCWLPLVLVAFGVSGAGIAGALDAYRPLFITLTVAFLAAAFYFTYRPRQTAPASVGCCATAKDCCTAPTGRRRFSMMTLNKVMLWGVTVLAVAFLFFPQYMKFFLAGGGGDAPAANNRLVRATAFSVEGMTCEGCAALVEKAVRDVPGVLSVKADYERKRAVVTSEACCPAPTKAVLDALRAAGYRATVVETDPAATTKNGGTPQADCCDQPPGSEKAKADAKEIDPARQIVFKVEGLSCPAVKGIGCGHMLRPVLASLDKINGVEASSTNYTGTLVRISVTTAADRDQVAERVRKALAGKGGEPVALAGDELKRVLGQEQWRGAGRIGELSAIEFHTLVLYRVKTFAKAEKLDKEATNKLVKIAEEQWDRITKEAKKDGATQPEDWGNRCKKALPLFLEQAKEVLTAEQVERFRQALTCPCRGDDRPEAPPAPTKEEGVGNPSEPRR
jgi:copper chaperone CopZ